MQPEGVIKFTLRHEQRGLRHGQAVELATGLAAWREILLRTKLVGRSDERYAGAGFGNLSGRLSAPSSPRGHRRFLISGTQTGGLPTLALRDFCVVESYSVAKNQVQSFGCTPPSSEALSHAAIYDLSPRIRFVFHGHSTDIWRQRERLRLPTTSAEVAYGTPGMAREVERLYRGPSLSNRRILAMGGHEDGIIAFGHTAAEAGLVLMEELAAALMISAGHVDTTG